MMKRTGRCLCGATGYEATFESSRLTACYCDMCQRWGGGPYFAITPKEVTWRGEENIKRFASSPWAERAFCGACGSSLFYRVTVEGPHQGRVHLAYGTLEDRSGFDFEIEWFIDKQPGAYAFTGERMAKTEAEVMALFAGEPQ